MVYIIQCLAISSKNYSKEKLEEYRQDFMKQIKEGCLLLPGAFKLADVVNTGIDSMASIEINMNMNNTCAAYEKRMKQEDDEDAGTD